MKHVCRRRRGLGLAAGVAALTLGGSCGGGETETVACGEPWYLSTAETAASQGFVVVPNVLDADVATAFVRLREEDLRVAIPESFSFAESNVPGAFRQDPEPGERVPPGSVVTLTQLRGPHGLMVALREDELTVPDLVGLRADEAVSRLVAECMLWGARLRALPPSEAPSLFAAYEVESQQPEAGSKLRQVVDAGNRATITAIGLRLVPIP